MLNKKLRHFNLDAVEAQGGKVLRYHTGPIPHWFFRSVCIANNLSYQAVRGFRISQNDTWVVVHNTAINEPFTDEPLLP
jgi:hypothetical protein